ncbi:MAG: STAS domain-containing protein [Phycisphaerales bacterium]|jgi:anti-anti-sigma factor|nr:STAS domain-containing protein [Phycisphaerales bacterium]MDP6693182.1 STAS domain-containing protein [Phycisphaerales bacterium]
MNIVSELHIAATVLRVSGELTSEEADNFKRSTRESTNNFETDIVVDCSELTLIDSVGLESLLWLSDETRSQRHRFRLACVPEMVTKILRLTRLDGAFSTHNTIEEAAKSLNT